MTGKRSQGSDVGRPESHPSSVTPTFPRGASGFGTCGSPVLRRDRCTETMPQFITFHVQNSLQAARLVFQLGLEVFHTISCWTPEQSLMYYLVMSFLDYRYSFPVLPHALDPCMVLQVEMWRLEDHIICPWKFVESGSCILSTFWTPRLHVYWDMNSSVLPS